MVLLYELILKNKRELIEEILTTLDHARLGVRVDAAAALARQVGDPVGYDPVSVGAERRQAIARWQSQASATLPGGVVP